MKMLKHSPRFGIYRGGLKDILKHKSTVTEINSSVFLIRVLIRVLAQWMARLVNVKTDE